MSLMNHNKLVLIPSYFNNPKIIVDTTQILCLKFTFGNYIWINFAGTYLGATLVDAFDIRYTPINMDFKVHRGFHRIYTKYIKPQFEDLLELNQQCDNMVKGDNVLKGDNLVKGDNIVSNKKLIISGYSLGGVLAVLLLCDILKYDSVVNDQSEQNNNQKKLEDRLIKCNIFATPRFGCKKMHDYFSTYDKLLRVEYEHDNIPKFAARNFHNIGIKKKFNLDNNIPGIINTHYYSYETYYKTWHTI